MDDFADSADEFLDASLGEVESRHDLQRRVALGNSVAVEQSDSSSVLRQYMDNRRAVAMKALVELAHVDPKEAMSVHQLQVMVREYLTVREWVHQRLDDASAADEILQEIGSGQETDDEPRQPRRASKPRRR